MRWPPFLLLQLHSLTTTPLLYKNVDLSLISFQSIAHNKINKSIQQMAMIILLADSESEP